LLPFALFLAWRQGRARPWLLALVILPAVLLLLLWSRAALLAVTAGLLVAFIWRRISWPAFAAVTVGFVLLALTVFSRGSDSVIAALASLDAASKTGEIAAISWQARLEVWRAGWAMAADYPVLGAGLYLFEPISRTNYPYEALSATAPLAHAHNLFLETAATLGWPAALALLLLWLATMRALWGDSQLADRDRLLVATFGGAITAYLTFNMVDGLTLGQKPGVLVWLLLAGVAALGASGETWSRPATSWGRLAPVAPLLLLAGLALSPALPANLANRALDRWRLSGASAAPDALERRLAGDERRLAMLALLEGDEARALDLFGQDAEAVAFLHSQGRLASLSDPIEALTWFDLGLRLEPGNALLLNGRGYAHEKLEQLDLALADYAAAARLAPANGLSQWRQGLIYYSWGDLLLRRNQWVEAAAVFRRGLEADPGRSWLYLALGDALARAGDEAGAAAAYAQAAESR
jgi:hypothetical protein